ncbi:hypothetical protein [Streptomyces similanensis]
MQIPERPPLPDLTDKQVESLLREVADTMKELVDGFNLATEYYSAGGRDRATWNQIGDGLGRKAMGLMLKLSGPGHPYAAQDARNAIREAAGMTPQDGGTRETIQQTVAMGVLATLFTAGQHHMVEPSDWLDELPAVVLGSVRNAQKINADPTMANLRDKGHPG